MTSRNNSGIYNFYCLRYLQSWLHARTLVAPVLLTWHLVGELCGPIECIMYSNRFLWDQWLNIRARIFYRRCSIPCTRKYDHENLMRLGLIKQIEMWWGSVISSYTKVEGRDGKQMCGTGMQPEELGYYVLSNACAQSLQCSLFQADWFWSKAVNGVYVKGS